MNDQRYYCFPDIHGRYDLLQKALDFVYRENPLGGKIIFLGDYIDRGPENKKVLETVMNPKEGWDFICLAGNHEEMFLDAISGRTNFYDPAVGLEFVPEAKTENDLRKGFPKDVADWMRNLKLFHFEGPNVFAHAYYDDNLLPEQQEKDTVLWKRMDDWMTYRSQMDRLFLTHGHTPRKHGPVKSPNRVNLDTGGVFYGRYVIGEYKEGVKGPVNFHEFPWHNFLP